MNIDINALMDGKAALPGKLHFKAEAPEGMFNETMDEKLAQLVAVLPAPGEDLLPVDPDAPQLPVDPTLPETPEDKDTEGDAGVPGVISLMPVTVTQTEESTPGWQLQQVISQNAGTAEAAPTQGSRKDKIALLTPEATLTKNEKAVLEAVPPRIRSLTTEQVQPPLGAQPAATGLQEAVITRSVDDNLLAPTQIQAQRPVQTMDTVARPAMAQSMSLAIAQPVGTPAWQQSLSQQLSVFTRNGIHNAEIKLHPEELGSLQITMRMQHDQAQLQIISEHPHVRQALEAALPQLRAALAESGVQLGQTNVSADSSASAGAQPNGQQHTGGQGKAEQGEDIHGSEEEHPQQILTRPLSGGYGINTFA